MRSIVVRSVAGFCSLALAKGLRIRNKIKLFGRRDAKCKCRLSVKIRNGEVSKRYDVHSNYDVIAGKRKLRHGSANDQHSARQLQIHIVLGHVNR